MSSNIQNISQQLLTEITQLPLVRVEGDVLPAEQFGPIAKRINTLFSEHGKDAEAKQIINDHLTKPLLNRIREINVASLKEQAKAQKDANEKAALTCKAEAMQKNTDLVWQHFMALINYEGRNENKDRPVAGSTEVNAFLHIQKLHAQLENQKSRKRRLSPPTLNKERSPALFKDSPPSSESADLQ